MKSRVAIPEFKIEDDPQELAAGCLEVSSESVLSVTNVVDDQ